MRPEGSLPSYDALFGGLDWNPADESRSVYSPAAYLADLLQLAEDCANGAGNNSESLGARRPDLASVPLDGVNSYTELPYLDIVNEVLARRLTNGGGADVYEVLAGLRYPFGAPFSLGHERLRQGLRTLGVDPVEMYRGFAPRPDPDVIAREYLALTPADVAMVTTVLGDGPDLRDCYHLDDTADAFARLAAVDEFRHATGLTGAELRELLETSVIHEGGPVVRLDQDERSLVDADGAGPVPVGWFDRVNRFVRLARRTDMSFVDLDLVLRTCCGGRIDLAALRHLAVVRHLRQALELPIAVVVSLVAPLESLGDLAGTGDILAAANAEYRRRVAAALGLAEPDLTAVVVRYRDRRAALFGGAGTGVAELSLLHRIARLTTALEIPVADLFAVLDALAGDPSLQRFSTFPILIHTGGTSTDNTSVSGVDGASVTSTDYDQVLAGGDAGASLWLLQTLVAVVRWSRAAGIAAADLAGILRADGPADDEADRALLSSLGERFAALEPTAEAFGSGRFGGRAAQVIHDVVAEAAAARSGGGGRLLRVAPDRVTATAHAALDELGTVASNDFLGLGLADRLVTKVYTNLMLAGYLAAGGAVVPERVPESADELRLRGEFGAHREALFTLIAGVCAKADSPSCYPSDLAALLGLTDAERAELYDNLIFNGELGATGEVLRPDFFTEPANVAAFTVDVDLGDLADDVHEVLVTRLTDAEVTPDDLRDLADAATARRVVDLLSESDAYLRDGRLTEEAAALVADPAATLALPGFTPDENATIAYQLRVILADASPYRLDPAALAALGFTADECRRLVAQLVDAGHLTGTLAVPADRGDYFGYAPNAADFALPGLTDFSADIFVLLHAVATELAAGTAHISAVLARVASEQRAALIAVLQDGWGVPAGIVEAICDAVVGGDRALDVLVEPVLDDAGAAATDPDLRRALRRMRGFARFAGAVALPADEVAAAFLDQDLAAKFPEPLALPAGVDRIDALLDSADGHVYVFHGAGVWVYSAATHDLVEPRPRPFAALSPALAVLVTVDTAFTDAAGAEWIAGRDAAGAPHTFVREPGHPWWLRRAHEWGAVANVFDDPAGIDAAFVDDGGRTYLFHRDQYVRYSGDGSTHDSYSHVDEGYPRRIADWWETEGRGTPLPARFRGSLDAAFRGRDGTTYLFAGDSFLAVRDGAVAEPVAGAWGRIANALAETRRIDAAYVDGPFLYVFAGNQVTRYTAGIEAAGVVADEGYPRRIEAQLGDVPAEFEGGVEAAFAESGVTHLFKDGRTVALGDGAPSVAATAQRWGRLHPALPTGTVDAALLGLDGHTYLFSGDVYLRYSGADYSRVDVGYPRRVVDDWGGLRRVDAAFVADGATHLFGAAGALFDVSIEADADELAAGRLPWRLRQRLHAHGIAVAHDATVSGDDPQWTVMADLGFRLLLSRTGDRLAVSCDLTTEVTFHVRYSTTDYAVADPGYPRPLSDNWWNLPEELVGADAAFGRVDAVFTARDNRTYLFAGDRFIVYDNKRRWWSEPRTLAEHWDSLPFGRVDAAFVGADDRTYLFSGDRYVRYSTADHSRVDDRYPAAITPFWGNVVNNIARTGRVDAALVAGEHLYLFSGDQFVRYTRPATGAGDPGLVDIGYPCTLSALAGEPRLGNLRATVDGVSAAFADRGTVYLVSGDRCHAVSDAAYRRYDDLAADDVGCALVEDGAVCVEHPDGWYRYSALEGTVVARETVRPRLLRPLPAERRTGLDAVLRGTDGNTYLFQGATCVNVELGREYPLAEEWGRPRSAIYHDNAVDAAFVGADDRTYVFRDDQFVVYTGDRYLDAEVDGEPRAIAEHWAGLRRVALAYLRDGVTYLFEPPDADGTARYVAYSGADYTRPDEGYPRTADATFWEVPDEYRPDGFTMPRAVLSSGTSTLLLIDGGYLAHHDAAGTWSYSRPLDRIWRGIGPVDGLSTAFTGRDGATYFFFDSGEFVRHDGRTAGARERIRARWARTRNNFLTGGEDVVDAAVVHSGITFLFSGDQYVRYSGPDYRYVDPGYPKPIVGNVRTEKAFAALPAAVEDELAERYAAGSRSMIDAAVADGRTVHLFVGRTCHAVATALTASYDAGILGRVRNSIADRGRVDAALVAGEHTYLFSGDQYVRYTGGGHTRAGYTLADDAYPRTIAAGLPGELGVAALPEPFGDGIDAAFRAGDGRTYLFAGPHCARIADGAVTVAPIRGAWGVVRNEFRAGRGGLDAAFVAATGELYAFAGGQYARYAAGHYSTVEDGYPRRIRDDWGDLPAGFERGVDGAFRFAGRTYLARGDEYVRYTGGAVDRTYPQPFRYRWSGAGDYRLSDLHTIARFAALARTHRDADGGLATFVLPDRSVHIDPYAHLAGLFGWDASEVAWCRRHGRLLTTAGGPDGADGDRLELEFLLALVDVFALAGRLGTSPSRAHADVWTRLYGGNGADPYGAADALRELLARRAGPERWPVQARQLHDELNPRKRDALVATVLADGGTSRDLFGRFLIDVDMGARGNTSRVREAIAATQMYLHRYLLNLELPGGDEETRQRVKQWWRWMRNYRVWEANRKVFLYPENYLRPELRDSRTPAFRALEGDLLQGEITADAVERAYKRYLDEYTEVSRLAIAGGYVYTKDQRPDGARRLVLFGRTRTDPRRYYYRRAEFASREKLSATWEPWQPVDVRIDADQVHPVHAFGRVFVFWAVPEAVPGDDPTGTTVVAVGEGGRQHVSGQGQTQRIRICYSFHNLTKEWAPTQTLGTGTPEDGVISDVTLLLLPRMKNSGQMSIVVSCAYTVTTPPDPGATGDAARPRTRRAAALFELNPELYAENLLAATPAAPNQAELLAVATDVEAARARAATAERVTRVFVDPVDPAGVVRFDAPSGTEFWFSVDHKGGSFLCRPVQVTGTEGTWEPLAGNRDRLPDWSRVDAAVELPNGTRYFFDNAERRYLLTRPRGRLGEPEPTGSAWGQCRTVLAEPGDVDAVIVRGERTFVLSGHRYVRFTGTPFGAIDHDYPRDLAGNDDELPDWSKVDVAFTGPDGVEYFFDNTNDRYVTSQHLDKPRPIADFWGRSGVPDGFATIDAAVVTDGATFLISGDRYVRFTHPSRRRGRRAAPVEVFESVDADYPRPLAGNDDGLPTNFPIAAAVPRRGTMYWFDNSRHAYHEYAPGGARITRPTHATSALAETGRVDAAWLAAGRLYLTTGREYVRYTLGPNDAVPAFVDDGYPAELARPIDAAFRRDDDVYLFSGDRYARIDADREPTVPLPLPVAGAWGELPRDGTPPFDAALDSESGLYMFVDDRYVRFSKTVPVRRPYELAGLPFEIIRLTTGTASTLSHKLLSGGVPALLDLATQETDEVAVTIDPTATAAIRVRPGLVDASRLPTGSHLDFRSANGLYYWEIFCHAPLLIAQALNGAQRFEDARRWYEYVFDPTNPDSYWRFLPFLTVDLDALASALTGDLAALRVAGLPAAAVDAVAAALAPVHAALRTLAPAVAQNRDPATEQERAALLTVTAPAAHDEIAAALDPLAARTDLTPAQRAATGGLRERTLMAADLAKQFDALGDRDTLLQAYRDDPFDPHAIADLRPVAYRRAVVMRYIDNLLDWGDALFRQHTPESVDEARMLYVLAYDLLGARPERLGTRVPAPAASYAELDAAPGDLDLIGYFTGGGTMLTGDGAVHAGVANGYFHIPANSVFDEYWVRVEDRLRKIRQSLNIMGISQPLPLFAPPIDPAALVSSVAAGAPVDELTAGAAVPVPHYRFAVVFRRAQELVDKLRQLGADLLSVLERGSAEELGLLQRRQEQEILTMTRAVKAAQLRIAEESLAELTASRDAARERASHYETLLATGMTELEREQLDRMRTAAGLHFASGVLKVAAGIAYALPEFHIGPFIVGTDAGGRQLGDSLDKAGETAESLGEGFGMIGEVLGIQAQHERLVEDWDLQLATARGDVTQLEHRITGATQQVAVARREADLLEREIAHNASVAAFLTDKFTNVELYGWMSGTLAGLYFQAYQLAYEMARAAERALQFERGLTGSVIRPVHWQSRRGGLLAGDSLGQDLDRLGKAYLDAGGRGLEITRQVSLRELDPIALLRLRDAGGCEFALAEGLYDNDFPGHYRRQIRTVTVTFLDAEGEPLAVPATLTQLDHKTVLEPDPQAVRYLLDPQGAPPATVRGDWRASQQIALSQPDYGRENNGLFELRFDDDRYLPFEGTGAVSRWRLERGGRAVRTLYDVVVTVKYTAEQGGEVFANAVRGLRKPYPAARFFDLTRDFPEEWTAFRDGDGGRLVLPFTAEMFPDLAGSQIGGVYATYELADGAVTRLVLGGDPAQTLSEGKLLPTPGLTIRSTAPAAWVFTVDGAKQNLRNAGLVLTYQARVQ